MENKIEPSKAELDILTVIWKHGPNTVRFVHNQLLLIKEVNYTTTLKQMQLMSEKGMLLRDESSMTHIYSVAEEASKTKSHLLDRFVNHIYEGSAGNLVMQLLDNKNASSEDLKVIREILNKLDKQD
ncbi:MAG TPA: BlaI/MecI/CopY family transcriptional regulator [Pedobacter sp.]|nr:BlaI/MecI/CopY family transcriptional regulator [Pedobacter sp.]